MVDGWIHAIAHASPPFLVMALVAAGFGLFIGFVSLHRYRLIEDVPTAKVRSAHQGYVELIGNAVMMGGEPIVAPLTQTQCCWYKFRVEERSDKHWSTLRSGISDGLFLLRDETGDCVIDPEGAEVDTVHSQSWFASGFDSLGAPRHLRSYDRSVHRSAGVFGNVKAGLQLGVGEYRYTEQVILDGDPVYAIGWFRSIDDSDRAETEDLLTREILREWKKQPHTLSERFDRDRDGEISQEEWERARRAARSQAREELAQHARNSRVHTLGKPSKRQFILSNREQGALVNRYKWRAALGFTGFFLGGAASTLMITTQYL